MNIATGELSRVVRELETSLPGSFVTKITQVASTGWVFSLKKGGDKRHLLLAVSKSNSRAHTVSEAPEKKLPEDTFGKMIKKTLSRTWLSSVSQPGHDRVIELTFETASGTKKIVAHLMGASGNVYLIDEKGMITGVATDRGKEKQRPGAIYQPPENKERMGGDDNPPEPDGFSFNRQMERRYENIAEEEALDEARKSAQRPLKAERKKTRKKIKALNADKDSLLSYADGKKIGDLLQANFPRLEKGTESVTLTDLFDPEGKEVTITLDPSKAASENIERYYKRFKKYEKGLPRIEKMIADLIRKEKELEKSIADIEATDSIDKLSFTTISETKKKVLKSPSKKNKKESAPPGRRFISSEGYLILVGKNDRENDELSGRFANGRDLWLHARDYPGSHVLVRLPKKIDLPQKTLREAAQLALKYSKAVKAGKGEVTYAYAKHVKKPKGFEAGKVTVADGKTIFVRLEKETIEKMAERARDQNG